MFVSRKSWMFCKSKFSSSSRLLQFFLLWILIELAEANFASHWDASIAIAKLLERKIATWFLIQQIHVAVLSVKSWKRNVSLSFLLASPRHWLKITSSCFRCWRIKNINFAGFVGGFNAHLLTLSQVSTTGVRTKWVMLLKIVPKWSMKNLLRSMYEEDLPIIFDSWNNFQKSWLHKKLSWSTKFCFLAHITPNKELVTK